MTTSSLSAQSNYSSNFRFEEFNPSSPSLPTLVERLKGLEQGVCEVLFNQDKAMAYFIYTQPSASVLHPNAPFHVSHISFNEEEKIQIETYGDTLLDRITSLARKFLSQKIELTVSDTNPETKQYLMQRGFTLKESPHLFEKLLDPKKKRKKAGVKNPKPKERKTYHQLSMKKEYILQIRDGTKTVEGRISERQILKYLPGDTIRFFYFSTPSDDVTCQITEIRRYSGFGEMLLDSGIENCLPKATSLEEAVEAYNKIPKYKEKAEKNGVTAIHLKLINNTGVT